MNKDIESLYQDKLRMYPHLKNIRDRLWTDDEKSRVSVMIGAGFSLNAEKVEKTMQGMSLWNDLKERLLSELSHRQDIEHQDVLNIGTIYEKEYGRSKLDEVLKKAIPDDNYEPGNLHHQLLKLPWADIYTTNYDTLLERSKKNVYERNYQVIYDINDIPNSVQPRIIKLHGSFPAHRPFIFTGEDYNEYPNKSSPFINMVQQSIMETTFVLIGFSGDDPNFEKWTTWVSKNLGNHMPKIYMIGYGIRSKETEFEKKGITLIDFQDLYLESDQHFQIMYKDFLSFLSHEHREEKQKWPYKNYIDGTENINYEYLKYNRENYPGWIVVPNDIRRNQIDKIRSVANLFDPNDIEKKSEDKFLILNELLWCYDQFLIPLDYSFHKKIKELVNQNIENINKKLLIPALLRLYREARFDFDQEEFEKYKNQLKDIDLIDDQYHSFIYESLLYDLEFGEITKVQSLMKDWDLNSKEIEWGIKKAVIFKQINEPEQAKFLFENYLQTIRKLLAIKPDDYRLLSLESIALYNKQEFFLQDKYDSNRLRQLSIKNCNSYKEFEKIVLSVREYKNKLGTSIKNSFDPGKIKTSISYGDYMNQELINSYTLSQLRTTYNFPIGYSEQYSIALENLKYNYPTYSLIKRLKYTSNKKIDDVLNREYVFKLNEKELNILLLTLKNLLLNENQFDVESNIIIESLSRIYFLLSFNDKKDIDDILIKRISKAKFKYVEDKNIMESFIIRAAQAKTKKELKIFLEKLFNVKSLNFYNPNDSYTQMTFFEPILYLFQEANKIEQLEISNHTIQNFLEALDDTNSYPDQNALIKLSFLEINNSLTKSQSSKFISILRRMIQKNHDINIFLYTSTFETILKKENWKKEILSEPIPIFYENGSYSGSRNLENYFNQLKGVFEDYSSSIPLEDYRLYYRWLDKFYIWWDMQEIGLLKDLGEKRLFLLPDYLKKVIVFLKNHILGVIPSKYLREEDHLNLIRIFNKLDKNKDVMWLYLIPGLKRCNISLDYTVKDIISKLYIFNFDTVVTAIQALCDYLIFIYKEEIKEDPQEIKYELMNIMKYGNMEIRNESIQAINYLIKFVPEFFNVMEINTIVNLSNSYLKEIKDNTIDLNTREDINLVANFAELVTTLYKNNKDYVEEKLEDWIIYIQDHRLPEVRKNIDILIIDS